MIKLSRPQQGSYCYVPFASGGAEGPQAVLPVGGIATGTLTPAVQDDMDTPNAQWPSGDAAYSVMEQDTSTAAAAFAAGPTFIVLLSITDAFDSPSKCSFNTSGGLIPDVHYVLTTDHGPAVCS